MIIPFGFSKTLSHLSTPAKEVPRKFQGPWVVDGSGGNPWPMANPNLDPQPEIYIAFALTHREKTDSSFREVNMHILIGRLPELQLGIISTEFHKSLLGVCLGIPKIKEFIHRNITSWRGKFTRCLFWMSSPQKSVSSEMLMVIILHFSTLSFLDIVGILLTSWRNIFGTVSKSGKPMSCYVMFVLFQGFPRIEERMLRMVLMGEFVLALRSLTQAETRWWAPPRWQVCLR